MVSLAANTDAGQAEMVHTAAEQDAIRYGQNIGDAVNETFAKVIQAKEDADYGALSVMFALEDAHDPEWMNGLPVAGTKYPSNNPETIRISVMKDGELKEKDGNAFRIMAMATQKGREYLHIAEQCKLALDESKADQAEEPYRSRSGDTAWLKAEQNKYLQRVGAIKNLIRTAARLWHKMAELAVYDKEIIVDYQTEPTNRLDETGNLVLIDGEPERRLMKSKYPMVIRNARNAAQSKALSISQFLNINVGKASKMTGGLNYQNVLASSRSKQKEPSQQQRGKVPEIKKLETLYGTANVVSGFLDNGTEEGQKHLQALLDDCAPNKKHRAEAIKTIGAMVMALDPWWNEYGDEYMKLSAADRAAQKTAKAA